MTNLILFIGIILGLAYALYDQIIMPKLKGDTKLAVDLQRQAGIDVWISIGLIVLTILQGLQTGISGLTLYLLGFCIILCVYLAFFRSPRLLLKPHGFFFANVYFHYHDIHQINLAEQRILVIDLKNGRRLVVRIQQPDNIDKVVQFFGGYKQ